MIHFRTQDIDFALQKESVIAAWLKRCVKLEARFLGTINYVFATDEFVLEKNQTYLDHDTYTDIITFDYCEGEVLNGDILISIDRVRENAAVLEVAFEHELNRVLAHGLLHLCGYGDKSEADAAQMREKEEEWLASLAPRI